MSPINTRGSCLVSWDNEADAYLVIRMLHGQRERFDLGSNQQLLAAVREIRSDLVLYSDGRRRTYRGIDIVAKLDVIRRWFNGFYDFVLTEGVEYDPDLNEVTIGLDCALRVRKLFPDMMSFVVWGQPMFGELREIFVRRGANDVDFQQVYDAALVAGF